MPLKEAYHHSSFEAAGHPPAPVELAPHQPVYVSPDAPLTNINGCDVAAEVQLGYGEDKFLILDLRRSTEVGDYKIPFTRGGGSWDKDLQFLIMDLNGMKTPDSGYKGLRLGETVTLGRYHNQDRFDYSHHVSREHLKIRLDEQGQLSFEDLGSTNGTYLSAREHEELPVFLRSHGPHEEVNDYLRERERQFAAEQEQRRAEQAQRRAEERQQRQAHERQQRVNHARQQAKEEQFLSFLDPHEAEQVRQARQGFADIRIEDVYNVVVGIKKDREDGKSDQAIYRRLAKRFHSDVSDQHKKTANEKLFKLVGNLYDQEKREFGL